MPNNELEEKVMKEFDEEFGAFSLYLLPAHVVNVVGEDRGGVKFRGQSFNLKEEIHDSQRRLVKKLVGEIEERLYSRALEKLGADYPRYCACDGECFGECKKTRDNTFNEAISIINQSIKH